MKLFIIAAGRGTRLLPLTKDTPKLLIDVGDGKTILDRHIHSIKESNLFDEVIIITGYLAENIGEAIKKYEDDIKITQIYNPFYDSSNNLISLWTAHYKMLEDDFMITNGDNIYIDNVYGKVQSTKENMIQLAISYKSKYDEDDMYVKLDDKKNILMVSKDIDTSEKDAISVGLVLVKGIKSRTIFKEKLIELAGKPECINNYWLDVFNSLAKDGIKIETKEIGDNEWKEIDFHPDVETIRTIVFNSDL